MDEKPAEALSFGAERRQEAQLILQVMMQTMTARPYRGTFHVADAVPVFLVAKKPEDAGRKYAESLFAACRHWGATVVGNGDVLLLGFGTDASEELQVTAPFERVMISSQMPFSDNRDPDIQASHMMEGCAEVVRVLLAGAIINATADADGDEFDRVIVRCRSLDVVVRENLELGELQAVCRFMGNVVRAKRPGSSYLMGSEAGQAPFNFDWSIPLVECFYGPQRMHWLDQRSPGHLMGEQVVAANEAQQRVLAS
jgi:hypothetical protein